MCPWLNCQYDHKHSPISFDTYLQSVKLLKMVVNHHSGISFCKFESQIGTDRKWMLHRYYKLKVCLLYVAF